VVALYCRDEMSTYIIFLTNVGKNILNHMKCEQYVYKENYLYIYYIIFLTKRVPMYNIRVDGGVSHRSRTFLGLFRKMKKICLVY